ncbi:hypothetical protein K1719_030922 [Acacia pycnantha]|nr:hypothetical protein K1719_030922 [Acacia pycnantha]
MASKAIPEDRPSVEDDQVIIDIKEMIKDCGDGVLSPKCCIYRVPTVVRHLKEEAYTPQVVSIGPFHHGNEMLQDMERHKPIFFKRFTQRFDSSWHDLVPFVKRLVPAVRASYSETINLTQQQLVKLILMDAGFIIELFISSMAYDEELNDAKFSQPWLDTFTQYDLLLLENQLPFFVIEELFNKAFPYSSHDDDEWSRFHRPRPWRPDGWIGPTFLKLTRGGKQCTFTQGQCIARSRHKVEDTSEDVDLLIDKKIVRHSLGDSRNVASLFNGLLQNVLEAQFNSEYIGICKRLNGYCEDPMHKMMATLRQDYCNTPWRTVTSIAGIILLVLNIVQTIFSVLQVVLK